MQHSFTPLYKREALDWPFFNSGHREYLREVEEFADSGAMELIDFENLQQSCRQLVAELGRAKLLRAVVPEAYGGFSPEIQAQYVTLAREALAYRAGLLDFTYAMQGLGSGAISLEGSEKLKRDVLPKVAKGEFLPAFALSEKDAGSDVGSMTTTATKDGSHYIVNGEKTWISNGGVADVYCVFARTGEAPKSRGISAFVVYPDDPGFSVVEQLAVMAPHPLAALRFDETRIPASRMLGAPGTGFSLAMRTLDIFRNSVAGVAVGIARRALDEALAYAQERKLFGSLLSDFQITQDKLALMGTKIDAAALLTYRAAWRRDVQKLTATREVAMAKMTATELAQDVVDSAMQIFGGHSVRIGNIMERLYREVRALRIYEGATEIQKIIVAREFLKHGVTLQKS